MRGPHVGCHRPKRAEDGGAAGETVRSVRDLIGRFGRPGERPNVHYPVAAVHRAGLWELDADPWTVPNAHGSSVPQRWFEEHRPRGGLVSSVYELVRDSASARDAAVDALPDTYFMEVDPRKLLDRHQSARSRP